MKKKVLIVTGIILAILVVAGLITSYADSARVRNGVEPKFTIKIVTDGGNKVTYWGLGYKVVRYPSVSPNEPYKNNRGVKYGSWFMKYELEEEEESKYTNNKIEVIKPENYDTVMFNKYLERDNRTIYLAGNIGEVYYTDSETRMSLKDYISKSYQTLDDSIKHLTDIMDNVDTLNDGGTTIHKSKAYDITIIKCNTIAGNKNIFIGDYSMKFDSESMCK